MLRRWLFWLPASYVAFLCLASIDMAFRLTGDGEANIGGWMYIFSFMPAMLVAKAFGGVMHIGGATPVMAAAVFLQVVFLMILGAAIDALGRQK